MSFRSNLLRASALKPVAALSLAMALLLGSAAILPGAVRAEDTVAETPVSLSDQTGVAITIYNQDLALVRDQRKIALTAGLNDLAFADVSALMRPETALLRVDGARVTVREQNFNFDLLTPEKLLEKSVGRKVRVITTNTATGAETTEDAIVLSVSGGVVLKIGDRIETTPPGRIVFDEVPPNLRARPTLVIDADSDKAGTATAQLSYLTGGLNWAADYVASLSPDYLTTQGQANNRFSRRYRGVQRHSGGVARCGNQVRCLPFKTKTEGARRNAISVSPRYS